MQFLFSMEWRLWITISTYAYLLWLKPIMVWNHVCPSVWAFEGVNFFEFCFHQSTFKVKSDRSSSKMGVNWERLGQGETGQLETPPAFTHPLLQSSIFIEIMPDISKNNKIIPTIHPPTEMNERIKFFHKDEPSSCLMLMPQVFFVF